MTEKQEEICPDCKGLIKIRNPTGKCDHLYYPDNKPKQDICEYINEWVRIKKEKK